ncbi:transcriptional regulator [Actinoplanes auranticolor]|nr:transcriptional regulator [Actinoplanes auranticolor]
MHPPHLRERATAMMAAGIPFGEVCKAVGLPRGTVAHWFHGERARRRLMHPPEPSRCPRCRPVPGLPQDQKSYSYLLGLYLGDGHLVTSAKVPVLRVSCTATWPGLIDECETAMLAVLARNVQRVRQTGCINVQSYASHWPCLLPQHGPGRKHERSIRLTDWQQPVIDGNPGSFLRGLFHSDGCRVTNKVVRSGRTYLYPRYMFSNESTDIMALCQESLDQLGLRWRMCRRNLLSVARRDDVRELDQYVGPKH